MLTAFLAVHALLCLTLPHSHHAEADRPAGITNTTANGIANVTVDGIASATVTVETTHKACVHDHPASCDPAVTAAQPETIVQAAVALPLSPRLRAPGTAPAVQDKSVNLLSLLCRSRV